MSCVVLLRVGAVAFNVGGWPFGNLLPFVDNLQSTDNAPKNHDPKSAVPLHAGLEVATQKDAWRLNNSLANVDLSAAKNLNVSAISKMVERREALLKSSSIATERYASNLAAAQAIFKEQKRAQKAEEQAEAVVERELVKLRSTKELMMEVTKNDINRSPLDPLYSASRNNVSKAGLHVTAAEERVATANGREMSIKKDVTAAASKLREALEDKAKYGKEMKATLNEANNLEILLEGAQEQRKIQMQSLETNAAELEDHYAAWMAAISDVKNDSTAVKADHSIKQQDAPAKETHARVAASATEARTPTSPTAVISALTPGEARTRAMSKRQG